MKKLVDELIRKNLTISTMESCTGGGVSNAITNISGSSQILKFSAVTYSNEFKIKMGVSSDIIDKYSVYSIETAMEMSECISNFTNSDFGIGITGKLNRADDNNPYGDDSTVFVSIYSRSLDKFYNDKIVVLGKNRKDNKESVIKLVEEMMLNIIKD